MEINLAKTYLQNRPCFVPVHESDKDEMQSLPRGEVLRAVIKKDRNPRMHNKFMAMCRTVLNNCDKFHSMDHVLAYVKFKLLLLDYIEVDGEVRPYPKSISFSAMDDTDFERNVYIPGRAALAEISGISIVDLESNFGKYL